MIGLSTKSILHVIVLQSSLMEHPSPRVFEPPQEPPTSTISSVLSGIDACCSGSLKSAKKDKNFKKQNFSLFTSNDCLKYVLLFVANAAK